MANTVQNGAVSISLSRYLRRDVRMATPDETAAERDTRLHPGYDPDVNYSSGDVLCAQAGDGTPIAKWAQRRDGFGAFRHGMSAARAKGTAGQCGKNVGYVA